MSLVKIITLFLIGMLVLAIFGRLRLPSFPKRAEKMAKPAKCKKCGAFLVGTGPCGCGKPPVTRG